MLCAAPETKIENKFIITFFNEFLTKKNIYKFINGTFCFKGHKTLRTNVLWSGSWSCGKKGPFSVHNHNNNATA